MATEYCRILAESEKGPVSPMKRSFGLTETNLGFRVEFMSKNTIANNEPLTPQQAIDLLDRAIKSGAVPANSSANHWRLSFGPVLRAHPEFAAIADIHVKPREEFERYFINRVNDMAPDRKKDRISRFRGAWDFTLKHHRDPLYMLAPRERRARSSRVDTSNSQSASATPASNSQPAHEGEPVHETNGARAHITVNLHLPSTLTVEQIRDLLYMVISPARPETAEIAV